MAESLSTFECGSNCFGRLTTRGFTHTCGMNRIPVVSSVIRSVGYDREAATLEIEFINGAVYEYSDVPEHIYIDFLSAESKGAYFDAHIRRHEHPCRRLL